MFDLPDGVIKMATQDFFPTREVGEMCGVTRLIIGELSTATVAAMARAHGLCVAGKDEVVVPRELFDAVKNWLDSPTDAPVNMVRINAWMKLERYMDLCAMLAAAERQEQDDAR